jgi:hypothetical protein
LVVRFRRSHGIERQQLKWFTYAAALAPLPFLAHDFAPSLSGLLETLVPPLVPISVGIAILRYRLYEIDRIINRTLVYLLLTAVLGLCYAAGSLVFVLVAGTAADPPSWLVAAATLAATASNPPAPCAPNTDPSSVAVAPPTTATPPAWPGDQSRLPQTSAQASSTNAKNRPESRSQRTCSRLKQLNHDSARSTRQR